MEKSDYDYSGYEKSLERILSLCEKDYWVQYVDVNRHQINVAKTYLWVSAALLGAYTAFLSQYKELLFHSGFCTIVLSFLSFLSAIIAFGVCLYAMPARKGYIPIPNPSWSEFSKLANDKLKDKNKHLYIYLLTSLIDRVDIGVIHNLQTNTHRAKLLRITSWVLVFSFLTAITCSISMSFVNINISISTITKEVSMTNENETSQPENTPQAPTSEEPDVPTPAGPIGNLPPNYTTHGLDPKDITRITEDANPGGETRDE